MTSPAERGALERVAKLLPSLARDNDNEVVNTARAIVRALVAGGMDLHGLAAHVRAAADPRLKVAVGPGPQPAPATKRRAHWPDFAEPNGAAAAAAAAYRPPYARGDPHRDDKARAYAFGGNSFVAYPVSNALRNEIKPHRARLSEEDVALFDAIDAKLERGELLAPTVHSQLLDIAVSLRSKP